MIDVWGVAAHSLWILGLAVIVAVLSWAGWAAGVERVQLRTVLGRPQMWRMIGLGLSLFCVGMAATGSAWWDWVLWGFLAAAFAVQAWRMSREETRAE